jgi:membrane protease YdiL (CAAX protease family)
LNESKSKTKIDWPLAIFFALAYLIAWPIGFIFGVDDEALRATHSPPVATILIYLPKFAFTISGLIMFWYTRNMKEMWTRLTHWRVHWDWYALAYLGPALLYLASAWTSNLLSSNQPLSPVIEFPSILWMLTFGTQTGIITYFLFRGGLGEEIGLRGFALTRLQTRHPPLKASLIIGFWWGLWHLPAWTERSILEIAITWLGVLSFSMIFTWFYNNTISLPIVMLLHASLNSFDDVYETIFPALVKLDWELPYIAGILLLGIAFAFTLNRNPIKKRSIE